jgi:glycosyltransferase involved in cell wall biosynthesis
MVMISPRIFFIVLLDYMAAVQYGTGEGSYLKKYTRLRFFFLQKITLILMINIKAYMAMRMAKIMVQKLSLIFPFIHHHLSSHLYITYLPIYTSLIFPYINSINRRILIGTTDFFCPGGGSPPALNIISVLQFQGTKKSVVPINIRRFIEFIWGGGAGL